MNDYPFTYWLSISCESKFSLQYWVSHSWSYFFDPRTLFTLFNCLFKLHLTPHWLPFLLTPFLVIISTSLSLPPSPPLFLPFPPFVQVKLLKDQVVTSSLKPQSTAPSEEETLQLKSKVSFVGKNTFLKGLLLSIYCKCMLFGVLLNGCVDFELPQTER